MPDSTADANVLGGGVAQLYLISAVEALSDTPARCPQLVNVVSRLVVKKIIV